MKRSDVAVGSVFLALGLALAAGGAALPSGMGRLPGPGFFPLVIGAVMTLLAGGVLLQARRAGGEVAADSSGPASGRLTAAVAGLLFAYLLLWGTGLFALRTAVFLALLLRMLGQSWRTSAAVGLTLTAAIVLAFQYGLRVSLE